MPGAVILVVAALMGGACQNNSDAREAPARRPDVPPLPPVPRNKAAQRPPGNVVIAVDQSSSVAGFAKTRSIEQLVQAAGQSLRRQGVTSDRVRYFSVGDTLDEVPEANVLDAARFNRRRADLVGALASPEITSADLAAIVTDGQPSSSAIVRSACTPLSTEDAGGLATALEGWLDKGRGVWLILERAPFQGTVFLNCSVPTAEINTALARRPQFSCNGKAECTYAYAGDRVVLTIVQAAPAVIDSGARYVDDYVAQRPGAAAVRLHRTSAELWTAEPPRVQIVGEHAVAPVATTVKGDVWQASVACPNRDSAVRICARAKPPDHHDDHVVIGLANAKIDLLPDHQGELHRLPADSGFHASMLAQPIWRTSTCSAGWASYVSRTAREAAVPSACPSRGGEQAAEVMVACGCLHPGAPHSATIVLSQAYLVSSGLATWAVDSGYAAHDATWFDEPDRINGLGLLLDSIARFWVASIGKQQPTIGRLQLTISPAR